MIETNRISFQRQLLKGAAMEQAALRGAWLGVDLVALGWQGSLAPAHATTLKAVLEKVTTPILLTRSRG